MGIQTIKRMAGEILGVGMSRIKFNNEDMDKIKSALTKDDVRGLIGRGSIVIEKARGVSRANAKERQEKKKSGQRRGQGTRKGKKGARSNQKEKWINSVRKQRKTLITVKPKLLPGKYRKLRGMVKGGFFRSKAHVVSYIKEKRWVTND